jgi:hypothetical protein
VEETRLSSRVRCAQSTEKATGNRSLAVAAL